MDQMFTSAKARFKSAVHTRCHKSFEQHGLSGDGNDIGIIEEFQKSC